MELTPAFVLHSRPYRETSMLVQLFTFGQGKISVVAKGGRSKRSPWRANLQPFTPLLVSFKGHSELKNLHQAEPSSLAYPLFGDALYSCLYLNELLYYVLADGDAIPELYEQYQQTLFELASGEPIAPVLRVFELKLLALLGYGLEPPSEFDAQEHYYFWPGEGFLLASPYVATNRRFSGQEVECLCQFSPDNETHLLLAKRFCRQAIATLLGGRTLKSRELFVKIKSGHKED
jgi:DNA repair protein RecO (recombination protein O)